MEYLLFLVLLLYLLPWLVASGVEHRQAHWILAVVLLLGWTGVGWLVALAWAWRGRPRHYPPLRLAAEPVPERPPSGWRRLPRLVGGGSLAAVCAAGLVWYASFPPERTAISGEATLLSTTAPVHRGPGDRWARLGSLEAPCEVSLLERAGSWRRVWRSEECAGSMAGNAGWLHAVHLTRGGD